MQGSPGSPGSPRIGRPGKGPTHLWVLRAYFWTYVWARSARARWRGRAATPAPCVSESLGQRPQLVLSSETPPPPHSKVQSPERTFENSIQKYNSPETSPNYTCEGTPSNVPRRTFEPPPPPPRGPRGGSGREGGRRRVGASAHAQRPPRPSRNAPLPLSFRAFAQDPWVPRTLSGISERKVPGRTQSK